MNNLKLRIRDWLEIKDPPKKLEYDKELKDEVEKLKSELDFWKRTFRKYSRIPCGHCGKEMHVYPFGGAYYTHEGVKVHAGCYEDFLTQKKNHRA